MGRPKGNPKKEHYYVAAKKHGYRARSAYKLRQMATRYDLLKGVRIVIELCCSPGGWTQVLKEMEPGLEVIAADLSPMQPIEGVKFVQGDITDEEIISEIETLARGAADLVISDCSPKVSGQWNLDVTRQLFLAEATLDLGHRLLGPKGKVLAKVFQGPGFEEFMARSKSKFGSVKMIKPEASRKTSAEMYILAIGPRKSGTN
ncbi:MAG: RlmE family RNA methyltransferase [Candidatus Thorarchaeota archaeon]|nr:RlmE family RNA methyltransferase [Candidatus Thorarchaeota archaeon]